MLTTQESELKKKCMNSLNIGWRYKNMAENQMEYEIM